MPLERREEPWAWRAARGVGSIVGIGLLVLASAALVARVVVWAMAVAG